MGTSQRLGWWRRFRALPKESVTKTLLLALMVALICGVVVTTSTVLLQPRWQEHLDAAKAESLLSTLRSIPGLGAVLTEANTAHVQIRLVDLERGEVVEGGEAEGFDEKAAAVDPSLSVAIPADLDRAGIGRRAKLAAVYLLGDPEKPSLVVLPVYGLGYQSVIRAFLVLEGDLSTIAAFAIYEHQETPGMGSRIGEAEWLAGFRGKKAFADDGSFALRITTRGGGGPHDVDGISGATRSTTGVANLLSYWLGPHGYGPFLAKLKELQG